MAKVYISFIGTNDYLPCTYFHDEKELQNIRFVQEATLHFFVMNGILMIASWYLLHLI